MGRRQSRPADEIVNMPALRKVEGPYLCRKGLLIEAVAKSKARAGALGTEEASLMVAGQLP